MVRLVLALLMLFGFIAGPLAADARAATNDPTPITTTLTFTGKLTAGRDTAGYFGPWGSNLAGKSFTATYTVVTFASSSVSSGVDLLSTANALPTTMSFSLTVNGRTKTGTATTVGTAFSYDGVGGLFTGGFDEVGATALQTTTAGAVTNTFEMNAMVLSAVHDILTDTKSLDALPSTTYTVAGGDQASGQFTFRQSPGSPNVLSYGIMSIEQLAVTSTPEVPLAVAVPEPGEWAMMGAGLGIAAFASRRRRRT